MNTIDRYICATWAAAPLILVASHDPQADARSLSAAISRANSETASLRQEHGGAADTKYSHRYYWSAALGLIPLETKEARQETDSLQPQGEFAKDPDGMLGWLNNLSDDDEPVTVYTDHVDLFLGESATVSRDTIYQISGQYGTMKANPQRQLVILHPDVFSKTPPLIAAEAIFLEMELPDTEARRHLLRSLMRDLADMKLKASQMDMLVHASASLTAYEIEQAVSIAFPSHSLSGEEGDDSLLQEMVRQFQGVVVHKLKRLSCLKLLKDRNKFDDIVGFNDAKSYLMDATKPQSDERLRFKGALFTGVPGAGKSLIAKALGNEAGLPVVLFDFSALLHGIVGNSEANLREALAVIDSLGLCVVIIDEIDKALGGTGGENDGGVMRRLIGKFLTWMNDRTSEAILIATSNSLDGLPPEFKRAGRWDVLYFVDAFDREQLEACIDLYSRSYKVDCTGMADLILETDQKWTGAEVAQCVRYIARTGCSVNDSVERIIPVTSAMGDGKYQSLLEAASKLCVSVNNGKPLKGYTASKKAAGGDDARRVGKLRIKKG